MTLAASLADRIDIPEEMLVHCDVGSMFQDWSNMTEKNFKNKYSGPGAHMPTPGIPLQGIGPATKQALNIFADRFHEAKQICLAAAATDKRIEHSKKRKNARMRTLSEDEPSDYGNT